MEIPSDGVQPEKTEEKFKRSERFEIDNNEFKEIEVDENRIQAIGKKWERFELLVSFIGASWMRKWRRFGKKVLAAGVFLVCLPFFANMLPIIGPIIIMSGYIMIYMLMIIGVVLIAVWALVKRESLHLFTPGGTFKIEGSAGFVEAVWDEVVKHQRSRDV